MRLGDERGVALVLVLLLLAGLSLLSAALFMTVETETKTSAAYQYGQQAFYVANAGLQRSVVWFNNQYTPHSTSSDYDSTQSPVQYSSQNVMLAGQTGSSPNYPESAVVTSFRSVLSNQTLVANTTNSGTYSVNATLVKYTPASFLNQTTFVNFPSAIERWRIDCSGSWGTSTNPLGASQVTAVIENSGNPIFDRALWGINSVSMSGNANIDSYDPSLGPYGGSNVGSLGSVGSNGSVSFSGDVTVYGDLVYGPNGSYTHSGSSWVTGQVSQLSSPHVFPAIPAFSAGTQNVSLSGHNTQNLTPGSYGDISLSGQSVCNLAPGVYYVYSISTSGQAYIGISGPTTIFVKSSLSLSGGSIVNSTQDPRDLALFFSGTGSVSMSGNTAFYGSVYAPRAPLSLSGNSGFFGSFIAASVSNSGTSDVHFDEGLIREFLNPRPFRVITCSQNTF